jgi:hypothetical protein
MVMELDSTNRPAVLSDTGSASRIKKSTIISALYLQPGIPLPDATEKSGDSMKKP